MLLLKRVAAWLNKRGKVGTLYYNLLLLIKVARMCVYLLQEQLLFTTTACITVRFHYRCYMTLSTSSPRSPRDKIDERLRPICNSASVAIRMVNCSLQLPSWPSKARASLTCFPFPGGKQRPTIQRTYSRSSSSEYATVPVPPDIAILQYP